MLLDDNNQPYLVGLSLLIAFVVWKLLVHFHLVNDVTEAEGDSFQDFWSGYDDDDGAGCKVVNWWEREDPSPTLPAAAQALPLPLPRALGTVSSTDMGAAPDDSVESQGGVTDTDGPASPSAPASPSTTGANQCLACGGPASCHCSRCHVTAYCSRVCQIKDWKAGHQKECAALQKRRSLAAAAEAAAASTALAKPPTPPEPDEVAPVPKVVVSSYDMFLHLFNTPVLTRPPTGLQNCGNTCFANAMLQCLLHSRPLAAYLLERQHSATCPVREASPKEWCLTCKLEDLAVQARAAQPGTCVSPRPITQSMRRICRTLSPGRQEDSHEFCISIVDHMANIMLKEHQLRQQAAADSAMDVSSSAATPDAAAASGDGALPCAPSSAAVEAAAAQCNGGAHCPRTVCDPGATPAAPAALPSGQLCAGETVDTAPAIADGSPAQASTSSNSSAPLLAPLQAQEQLNGSVESHAGLAPGPVVVVPAPSAPLRAPVKLDMRSQETTLMHHIFGGYVRWQTICTSCGHVSQRFELFNSLHVQITPAVVSMESGLEACFAEEWLDDDNKYKCDHCNNKVRACRRQSIEQAPNMLMVCLKRYGAGQYNKIIKRVSFTESLDLTPFVAADAMDSADATYRLTGVVVHLDSRSSTAFGHYISYVRLDDHRWFLCDDTTVKQVPTATVLSSGAYMLFYQRSQTKPAPDPLYVRPQRPLAPAAAAPLCDGGTNGSTHAAEPSDGSGDDGGAAASSPRPQPPLERDAAAATTASSASAPADVADGFSQPHQHPSTSRSNCNGHILLTASSASAVLPSPRYRMRREGETRTLTVLLTQFGITGFDQLSIFAAGALVRVEMHGRCSLHLQLEDAGMAAIVTRSWLRVGCGQLKVQLRLVPVTAAMAARGGCLPIFETWAGAGAAPPGAPSAEVAAAAAAAVAAGGAVAVQEKGSGHGGVTQGRRSPTGSCEAATARAGQAEAEASPHSTSAGAAAAAAAMPAAAFEEPGVLQAGGEQPSSPEALSPEHAAEDDSMASAGAAAGVECLVPAPEPAGKGGAKGKPGSNGSGKKGGSKKSKKIK